MAKPNNSIGRIKLPGESFDRPIVPYGLTDGTYYVSLPTLSNDDVIVTVNTNQPIKTLDTTATTAQSTNASEAIAGSGKIILHKIAKTGSYNDLNDKLNIENGSGVNSVQQKQSDKDVEFENPNYTPSYTYEVGAFGKDSAMFGGNSMTKGEFSTAIGRNTLAEGARSFASGTKTAATGNNAHAEGLQTLASGANGAHAEGTTTVASGNASHAEGNNTQAQGAASHTEGTSTTAFGNYSHSGGRNSEARGEGSFAHGYGIYVNQDYQISFGKYNKVDSNILFSIGNGTTNSARSNAFEVYFDGHAEVQTMGSTSASVATKQYVDSKTAKASDSDKLDGQDSTYYLNYNNLTNTPTLGTAASKNTGTSPGNVPVLDSNGKLAESVIPAVAITDTYEASSETAMLALSAQKGDICIRSDLNKSFVLSATPASTLANWKELKTPTDAVISVNGKTGAVQLNASDVGALSEDTTLVDTGTSSDGVKFIQDFTYTSAKSGGSNIVSKSTHTHTVTANGSVSLNPNAISTDGVKYVEAISSTGASASGTADVGSETHTHTYDKAIGILVTSNDESGLGTQSYLKDVSYTAATLTGTKTFNTDAIKSVALSESTTSTDGPQYIKDVTHTAATLTGTKTFNTDAIKSVVLSASDTSDDGPAYVQSVSGGSAVSATTKYMKFNAGTTPKSGATPNHTSTPTDPNSGTNINAVTGYPDFSGGSLGGTKTFVTGITAGSGSLTGERTVTGEGTSYRRKLTLTHTHTSASSSGTGTVTFTAATLGTPSTSSAAPGSHTHNYDKTTSVSLTAGTAPSMNFNTGTSTDTPYISAISGGSAVTPTIKHMKVTTTAASTGTVGISGGSISKTTRYMKATTTAATTGTVGINGGSITKTTKYLGGTLAYNPTTTGEPSETTTVVTGVTGGTTTATTKYLHPSFTGSSATTSDGSNATASAVSSVTAGSVTKTTKYMKLEEN